MTVDTVSRIRLTCDDRVVGRAVLAWLAAGRLKPQRPVSLDVRVRDLNVEAPDERPVFHQPGVSIRAGPPNGGVHISWSTAPAVAELEPGRSTATVTLSRAAALRLDECLRTFFMTALVFLLRRVGWHHIHAATAIDPLERGWLMAGDSHAGKSTTAALLACHGWRIGTDDAAFLTRDGHRVAAMGHRAPIALRPDGQQVLHQSAGVLMPERHKVGYWPEDLGGRWVARVEPEVLLFTSVGSDGARTHAEALTPRHALAELVRWSAWVILEPDLAHEHLALLASLARQARAFRVTLGRDLFTRPDHLVELVA